MTEAAADIAPPRHANLTEPDYRSLLESVRAIVWRADPQTFQTTFASRVAEDILGYPLEWWTGRPGFWIEHVHPDDRARVTALSGAAIEAGRAHDFEYRMIAADGRIVWLRNIVNVVTRDGVPVELVGVTTDITERKTAEFEAAKLRQELARVTSAAALGELSTVLAHELNQPLGAMVTNAETALLYLGAHPIPLEPLRETLEDIRRDAERGGHVVHGLHRLLGSQTVERRLLHVDELVAGVVNILRSLVVARGVELSIDVARDLPAVEGDAVQLQQVLLNLMLNAVEAMRGSVTGGRSLAVRAAADGGFVEVSVSDTGTGIRADMFPRLFEPFSTTKQGGLGMGLAMCRRIVEAHGGQIAAENNAWGGATFRFRFLPAQAPAEASHEA